eukprot:TRINITY_DN5847_c0_g1_i1.p1 TRINITY_DN5847_c0_g1~~TRINITY_DN5847_c0_g1_i1.p1  ORF type:complete len:560 (+),score=159.73 TRINITY_DN5847_c0_g1_i1:192-1682(+)
MLEETKGKLVHIALKQDTSRVVETAIKAGNQNQRDVIYHELKEHIIEMAQCKYSRFVVISLLKHCTSKQKNNIISLFTGQIRKLIVHKHAAHILEYVYSEVCNKTQKTAFIEEFYGQRFLTIDKAPEPRTLDQILEETPDKIPAILTSLQQVLYPLIEKGTVMSSIIHVPLLEYLRHAEYPEKLDMIERIKDYFISIIETKEGSEVGTISIGYGRAKDRKHLVKAFREYSVQVATHAFGFTSILKILTSVDDTVLVNKTILSEILEDLDTICYDMYGKQILLAIICGPTTKHFSPEILRLLEDEMIPSNEPDVLRKSHKKDQETLRSEHFQNIKEALHEYIKVNSGHLLKDPNGRAIVVEYLIAIKDEDIATEIINSILDSISLDTVKFETIEQEMEMETDIDSEEEENETDIMHDRVAHRALKELIKEVPGFSGPLLRTITENMKNYVAGSRSSWVVLALLEHESTEKETKAVLSKLKKVKGSGKGTQLIKQKLK